MSLSLDIDSLPPEQVEAAITRLEAVKAQREAENRLAHYVPYNRQAQFHAAGAKYRERLLMAGNQVGKTWAAAMETAMHVTGIYPDWWQGHTFDRPIQVWACGESNEVVRASVQKPLLGDPAGTGCIPKNTLLEVVVARGLSELADIIKVQHVSGEVSTIMAA
jgi:hypothetical protein